MITGELKSKVDKAWNSCWTGGLVVPTSVVEQLTYLLFIKLLDEREDINLKNINALKLLFKNDTEKLNNLKMLVVQPVNVLNMKNDGKCAVAIDAVGAGQGEIVLVVGGSSARQTEVTTNKPVDATINAIVDYIEIEGKLVYDKLAGDADYAKAQMAVKA